MKPLNSIERKSGRLKFISIYGISMALFTIALYGFLQPSPSTKNIIVEKEKPARIITKTVYVTQKSDAKNNLYERDSLIELINLHRQNADTLNAIILSQKNKIAGLQNQPAKANKPVNDNIFASNETAELKKQIKFYDWALRSQIAVTNTLTKENNSLKEKIRQFGKSDK